MSDSEDDKIATTRRDITTVENPGASALGAALGFADLHHVGWVVQDVERTVHSLAATLGCGPFHLVEVDHHVSRPKVRGEVRGPYNTLIAFAWHGTTLLELLQPTSTGSPYDDFMAANGQGLHHFAYVVPDVDRARIHLEAQGMRMLADGTGADYPVQACYLDADPQLSDPMSGVAIELVEDHPQFAAFMAPVLDTIGPRG